MTSRHADYGSSGADLPAPALGGTADALQKPARSQIMGCENLPPGAAVVMKSDEQLYRLHHDLRSVLSTASLSLRTLEMLEAGGQVASDKRMRIMTRADAAIQEAIRIAERIESTHEPDFGPHVGPAPEFDERRPTGDC
jgi:hypothetical protein